jgi:uncharacterized repeat protein (TIGR03803 family)
MAAIPMQASFSDAEGNLYGTTYNGGASGAGVVYKITPSGQESVLYSFTGGTDGSNPYAGVIFGDDGYLYGTTLHGGLVGFYAAGVIFMEPAIAKTAGRAAIMARYTSWRRPE